jgi:hypothetical protein
MGFLYFNALFNPPTLPAQLALLNACPVECLPNEI